MKKLILILGLAVAGCAESARTLPVLVWEDRPISDLITEKREPLVVPPDYRNPKLLPPKEDTVLRDWKKNNFK
jgi:hypothetical protein